MVAIGFSSTNINFVISRLPIFILPCIGYYVIQNYNRKEKEMLLFFFILIFGLNLIYNILLGFTMPDIFEEQESTELSIQFAVMMNIADTGFINLGVLIVGVLLMAVLVDKKGMHRFLCSFFMIPILYYMLFQNTRGTAILVLLFEIVGFIMAYYEPKNIRNHRPYYLGIGTVLLVMVFVLFIPIIEFIINHLESERLAERMNDLIDFKQYGGNVNQLNNGSFALRIALAQTSLNSFLSSPISFFIGIGDHTQNFGDDLIRSGVGGHSEFIDVAARYGIVGMFVFFNILKRYYLLLKKISGNRNIHKYVNVIFFIFILTGIFNNVFGSKQLIFLYTILPIIIEFTSFNCTSKILNN